MTEHRGPTRHWLWLAAALPAVLLAQGQDSTPAERNLQIIAALLPGIYDNANQAYFDQRRKLPESERRPRTHLRISEADAPYSFRYALSEGGETHSGQLRLSLGDDPELVVMEHRPDAGEPPCQVAWRREAGQFAAAGDCEESFQLYPGGLWFTRPGERPTRLLRAREFSCYVDIPGVAGGRDEPFDRYSIESLHDQGGLHWLRTKDGREIGITLRNVQWPINNEQGAFTRNSLVMYVLERDADGVRTHTYGWTEPQARRIGLNLQWLLVNCYLESNREITPYFE